MVLLFPVFATASAADIPVIALIGDSTVTDDKGWGGAFAEMLDGRAEVHNFAVGGRSAKSYTDENRLPGALAVRPDYVFIQFGHNGQPGKGDYRETDPEGSYRDYLRRFVADIRAAGAEPIIVSSLTRRHFGADGRIDSTLGPWAEGARAVAAELDVPFVDLHAASIELHDQLGEERSADFDYEPGDRTHLNDAGARVIAGLILDSLDDIDHPLANLRRGSAEADAGSAERTR
jgi:pectinesterase